MRLGKVTKDQNAKLQESAINDPPASKEQETLKSFQFARTNLLRTRRDNVFAEFVEYLTFQIKCRPLHSTFPITDTRQFAILNTSLDLSSISYICYNFHFHQNHWTFHLFRTPVRNPLLPQHQRSQINHTFGTFFRDIVVAGLREKSKPFLLLVKTRRFSLNLYEI